MSTQENNSIIKDKLDYKALGFMCGLEIHQQLDTGKLFCACSSDISEGKPDKIVMRRLRASAGESGKIDVAAQHEQKKAKKFLYHFYRENCCLVELDEEPPRPINKKALDVALQVALMLNMKIIDSICIMRKVVVDGSNTTGFQRTGLVAIDGFLETSKGKISIPSLCIEEESAQVIERKEDQDIYNLSRLGIPLLEIATGPEIQDPEHALECAEKIGMILRSTGKVKRGLGTIRQDVNLSVGGHSRVEIKGFQELKSIPKIIEFEVKRHLSLIKNGESIKGEVRKAEADFTTSYLRPLPSADRMYPETDVVAVVPNYKNIELPELIDKKIERLSKELGMNQEQSRLAVSSGIDIESLSKKYTGIKPSFIVDFFITMPKEVKARYSLDVDSSKISDEVFEKVAAGEVAKEAVLEMLVDFAKNGKIDYSKYKSVSTNDVESEIKALVDSNQGKSKGAIMGMAMAKFRGKIDGKIVSEIVNKLVKE